jgi:hypothetical protein
MTDSSKLIKALDAIDCKVVWESGPFAMTEDGTLLLHSSSFTHSVVVGRSKDIAYAERFVAKFQEPQYLANLRKMHDIL